MFSGFRSATCAPRIDERLVAAIARFDDPSRPIAETNRRVGALAEAIGLKRPSYQQVRINTHELRRLRRSPSRGRLLLEISLRGRLRSPNELVELAAGPQG
jgi:hypothetical protein